MINLSKKIKNKKNSNSKLYCPEDLYECEATTIFDTSEDWAVYSQQFKILMNKMTVLESKVLVAHLVNGESVTQMHKKFKVKKVEIISAIKNIKNMMQYYLGGPLDEKDGVH